jgi:hypothetical protein
MSLFFMNVVVFYVIATMIWDQSRSGQMYWWKWPLVGLMFGMCTFPLFLAV